MTRKDDASTRSTYLLLSSVSGESENSLVVESYLGSWETKSLMALGELPDVQLLEDLTTPELESLHHALLSGPEHFQVAEEVEAFLPESGASVVRVSILAVGGGVASTSFEVRRSDGRTLEVTPRFEEAFDHVQAENQRVAEAQDQFGLDDVSPAADPGQSSPRTPVSKPKL